MKTPLVLLNLVHHKMRTLVAVAGVAFAVMLIFMQLGFRGSAEATATVFYDKLDQLDLVLVAKEYQVMNRAGTFPRERLYQALSDAGVASASPLYISFHTWRNPYSGLRRIILLVGFDLADQMLHGIPTAKDRQLLQRRGTVLIDRRSHRDFGLRDGELINHSNLTEMGWRQVEVVGRFTLGTGFAADGAVLTSDRTFSWVLGGYSLERVSLGVLRLKPGADPRTVQERLRGVLPADVQVWTHDELNRHEIKFWLGDKPIGILFTCGVVVAFVVGVVFVYQIISSDIRRQRAEYATLKAMGYGDRYLACLVVHQALFLAALGYLLGLLLSFALYGLTRDMARIPIAMNPARAAAVFALALAMCSLSALLSVKKIQTADPADLF
jgi:putative ABC transport system permease protein